MIAVKKSDEPERLIRNCILSDNYVHNGRKCVCSKFAWVEEFTYTDGLEPKLDYQVRCSCGRRTECRSTWAPDVCEIWDHGREIVRPEAEHD